MFVDNAVRSKVAAATSSTLLLAANGRRVDAVIYNDSASAMYLMFGSSGTTDDFSDKIAANSLYVLPIKYQGSIYAVWDSATGNARVTEIY